jgi:hypothetical protein
MNNLDNIILEGYAIKNKKTNLYMKKGATILYSKYPQIFSKVHFVHSSITNKIKSNKTNMRWLTEIEVIDLRGNIIPNLIEQYIEEAIKFLETRYELKSDRGYFSYGNHINKEYILNIIQEQIDILKGYNTNE